MKKPRCGSKIYKGVEVPATSKIYISEMGREFYLSGTTDVHTIKFIDDQSTKEISINHKIFNK